MIPCDLTTEKKKQRHRRSCVCTHFQNLVKLLQLVGGKKYHVTVGFRDYKTTKSATFLTQFFTREVPTHSFIETLVIKFLSTFVPIARFHFCNDNPLKNHNVCSRFSRNLCCLRNDRLCQFVRSDRERIPTEWRVSYSVVLFSFKLLSPSTPKNPVTFIVQ